MQKKSILIFGITLLLLMPFVYADIAPYAHRAASLNFLVKNNNQTIEEDFGANILACSSQGCKSDVSAACKQGECSFHYYRIERVPSKMELQIHLKDKTFTSGAFSFSEKKPLLKYYYDVNINPDESVTITNGNEKIEQNDENWAINDDNAPIQQNNYSQGLRVFAYALALTIVIELAVLILFLRRWKVKKWKKPVLSLVLANIVSVPLVWAICIGIAAVLITIFQLLSIVIAVIIAEAFAVVFEAYFIHWLNKKIIPLKKSFILSLVMNFVSFAIGGIILAVLLSL